MIIFSCIACISIFIAYFYAIGLWYLGLIPLILLISVLVYSIGDISLKNKPNSLITDYGLFIAWIIIMLGLFLSTKFFGITTINILLFLVVLNILFVIGSYIFNYKDGKTIAHVGFLIATISLLVFVRIVYGSATTFQVFNYILSLYLALVGFIIFVVGLKYDIEKNYHYLFFILGLGFLSLLLYNTIDSIYIFLVMLVILLQILYFGIGFILRHKPPTANEQKEISIRHILAGERIFKKNKHSALLRDEKIYNFVLDMPQIVKYCLEGANSLIICVLIYLYFKNTISLQGSVEQIFYWIIMIGFIANVYSLKKINYTSISQRLITFLVINFSVYISLFSAFKDIGTVVFLCILRNILSASMVFSIHKTKLGHYLKKIDYIFWIFTTLLALIVNIILLFNTDIAQALLFPIILLYIGVQGFMIYYAIKYVNKIQEITVES